MNAIKGYCFTTKSEADIKKEIDDIWNLNKRRSNGVQEEKKLNKLYCEKTVNLLDKWFENAYGIDKYKRRLKPYKDSDDIKMLGIGKMYADEILLEINVMVGNMIPMKDLPSCKPLLDCSIDIAMECVKDMTNSKFAKIGLGLVSILAKLNDKVTIAQVWQYYNDIVNELDREVQMDSWVLTPVEQMLYFKARAERGYCYKAMLKTGVGLVHELKGIIDEVTADNDICNYECAIQTNDCYVIGR